MMLIHVIFHTLQTPLQKAQSHKNKGNKNFKGGKYKEAIKCYDDAIEACPPNEKVDLSTFYQNRAAAYEQQVNFVLFRCNIEPPVPFIRVGVCGANKFKV